MTRSCQNWRLWNNLLNLFHSFLYPCYWMFLETSFQGMYHLYILCRTWGMSQWHLQEHLMSLFCCMKDHPDLRMFLAIRMAVIGRSDHIAGWLLEKSSWTLTCHVTFIVWSPGSISDEQKINQSKEYVAPLRPLLLIGSYSVFKFELVLTIGSYPVFKSELLLTTCMVPFQNFCSSSLLLT